MPSPCPVCCLPMAQSSPGSDLGPSDLGPVKTFLAETLKSHIQGLSTQYNLIINQIRVKDDPETLWQVLIAMKSFVSILTTK
jgi:hypothetical protein